ncbi:MAG: hypothetical protein AAB363_02865, partial [Planctomycetota bacterium]
MFGCTGQAEVNIVPLGTKRIDATAPLIVRVSPDECYFWVNDREELCVAMRSFSRSIFGKRFEKEFLLSLVAKGLPAGGGREYRMDRRTARVRHDAGYGHSRSASLSGIFAVWNYRRSQLRGRFRFTAKEQSYSVLRGWSGNNAVLVVGEFAAVHDEVAGKKLLLRTEEGAMARSVEEPKAGSSP